VRICLVLQVARLVPHLSNGEFIVSERGLDPALNDVYKDMLVFVPADKPQVSPGWRTVPRTRKRGLLVCADLIDVPRVGWPTGVVVDGGVHALMGGPTRQRHQPRQCLTVPAPTR
jgi:hypothetical protein